MDIFRAADEWTLEWRPDNSLVGKVGKLLG
jgi:hypothetical protein